MCRPPPMRASGSDPSRIAVKVRSGCTSIVALPTIGQTDDRDGDSRASDASGSVCLVCDRYFGDARSGAVDTQKAERRSAVMAPRLRLRMWQFGRVPDAEVCVVQHGEKYPLRGDPGLSELGQEHATTTAAFLAQRGWSALYSSPLRRARETAGAIGRSCGLVPKLDQRLRERMNWGGGPVVQPLSAFLADWTRSTADRSWEPPSGASSEATGARMLAAIEDYVADNVGDIVVVSHGGATTDLLRTLFGDIRLRSVAPTILADGIGSCGLTWLGYAHDAWHLTHVGDRRHLGA